MTEDQQRAVIGEFIATRLSLQELKSTVDFVREEMAGLMVAFAESVPSRTPEPRNANSSLTNLETRLEKLELNAADMLFKLKQQREDIRNLSKVLDHRTERSATQTEQAAPGEPALSTLMNWYRGLDFRVNQLENAIPEPVGTALEIHAARIERLERNAADMLEERSATQTDQAASWKGDPARTQEAPVQITSSSEAVVIAGILRSCSLTIREQYLAPIQAAEYLDSYAETVERSATQTDQAASANRMYQAALENRCGICGLDRSVHLGGSGHDWVPTPATEPPVQDSTKTDPEVSATRPPSRQVSTIPQGDGY
jgi:hypothetical protein